MPSTPVEIDETPCEVTVAVTARNNTTDTDDYLHALFA
jgi:hypothetical protein